MARDRIDAGLRQTDGNALDDAAASKVPRHDAVTTNRLGRVLRSRTGQTGTSRQTSVKRPLVEVRAGRARGLGDGRRLFGSHGQFPLVRRLPPAAAWSRVGRRSEVVLQAR